VTVVVVLTCCFVLNFIKIGLRVRCPDAHNYKMFNFPVARQWPLPWQPHHGGHVGHGGMWPPKFHPNRSIDRQVIAFPTFCNMAAVRHLEYEFRYSGRPTKSSVRFNYPVKIWYRSDIPRRRYYDFINFTTLAGKCLTTTFLGVLNPLILWVVIQTPKRHILGWRRVITV